MRSVLSGVLLLASLSACSDDPRLQPQVDDPNGPPLGDLLPVDEELSLDGLEGPVDAVRDVQGRVHIYATSVNDAMVVQGYLVARDRHASMEFLRRAATGKLAEMLGAVDPSLIATDIGFRHIGLARAAEQIYAELDAEARGPVDAFASGVSQLYRELREGKRELPLGIPVIKPEVFTEWTAVDSLAIGRLQTWLLSYGADDDIGSQALIDDLRATFDAADPDAAVAARAGIERDYIRFAPPDPATIIPSLAAIGNAVVWPATAKSPPVSATDPSLAALIEASAAVRAATNVVRDHFAKQGDFGSNNWAVGPARSATSNAMLASDPHLGLGSPMTFWPVSIHVSSDDEAQNLNVGGIAFPGIPGIILGHNEHVAWGATVAVIDVSDAYRETLSADGSAVSFKGSEVPIETIVEEISDGKGGTISYEVKVVPHHGPILPTIVGNEVVPPDPALGALSVRWTGLGPSGEFVAVLRLMRASNVDDARAALDDFGTGGQNWMLADDRGDIAWTQHALVPYRSAAALSWDPATYSGQLPCFVLPGDGSAEWTGFWPDEQVPWAKNPPQGYLATANNDPVGGTLDNDPSNDTQPDGSSGYLSCAYADGHRQGRIQRRIEAYTGPLTLEDMSAIQGDHRSPLGARFTEPLLDAIANARQESQTPGSHPALSQIVSDPSYDADLVAVVEAALELWRDESNYAAASGVSPDDNTVLGLDQPEARAAQATLIFNAWLVSFGARVLGDELGRTGRPRGTGLYPRVLWHLLTADPPTLATYDAALGDSILFDDIDTPALETRQERMIVALVDALTWLSQNAGPVELWRWGQHHTVTFAPPAVLFGNLQIPKADDPFFAAGFPRHGDQYVVDASNFRTNREVGEDLAFSYGSGPTQRFVVEMTPEGPRAQNALPGGAVWDSESPHHADQAEAWRRNEVYDIPFALDAVLAAAESRTLITPH